MKKLIGIILALGLLFVFAACAQQDAPVTPDAPDTPAVVQPPAPPAADDDDGEEPPAPAVPADDVPFPGRIAVVTNTVDQNEEEFRSAAALVARYGDRVIHVTWPVQFALEGETMITILRSLAENPEVGAIIINQAVVNTNAALDVVRSIRGDDIFIVAVNAAEVPADVSMRVDLALDTNNPGLPESFVAQAVAMGAHTIVHYSFPRHMAVPHLAARRDGFARYAEAAGIAFHDLNSPDPMEEGGMPASQLFISQDVPRRIEEFGVDTVFFSTNCGQQIPLLQGVLAGGAMYVQPCCPSPFHAFPTALGLAADQREAMDAFSTTEIIELTRQAVAEAGLTGRLANWAAPVSMAFTEVGFYYAVEWLNGRTNTGAGVYPDMDMVNTLFGDYMERLIGERSYLNLTPQTIGASVYPRIIVGLPATFLVY